MPSIADSASGAVSSGVPGRVIEYSQPAGANTYSAAEFGEIRQSSKIDAVLMIRWLS